MQEALGDEKGLAAREVFAVTASGNAEGGASTLRLLTEPADWSSHQRVVEALLETRERRPRPSRDDKVVAAWNGLAIAAFAEAGLLLQEVRYLAAALSAARLLVAVHLPDGLTLRRASRDGRAGEPVGLLEDYACVAEGFLTLFAATGDGAWFERARGLVDQIETRFTDGDGGLFDTASDAESLVVRPRDPTDNATPSGHATTAAVMTAMFGLTGEDAYRQRAEVLLGGLASLMVGAPRYAGKSLAAVEAIADGPQQVAVVGPDGDESRNALVGAALRLPYPGLVIAQGDGATATVPLLRGRGPVDGRSAAYLCHDFVCDLPVTDPGSLAAAPQR
jgi:hypothetical protein